ncbi:hypothetical protein C2S53_015943 [Perilla frutescens var. hirtella]|uniref:Uncharacterized protein n=1 Tax=Perilla frutescens var. hirtella TaxID=608512 RepID=A0AAD4J743_PERFH|nr:hypothetical protein C2S53_015943 [Perilla frutescens var. hirtella]
MNEAHKQSVRDMGFGVLLNLDIHDVPPKIAYWILENFDTKRGEIILNGNRRVHISENDVQLIFGFPKGHRPIVSKAKNALGNLTEQWLKRFEDKNCKRIRASYVADDMIDEGNGGLWFKRQFLVLVTSCLIERIGNCYMSPQILDTFQDVDSVSELNWCGYVIKCLIEHTRKWQANKCKNYTGPSLFITDEVVGVDADQVAEERVHDLNGNADQHIADIPDYVAGADEQADGSQVNEYQDVGNTSNEGVEMDFSDVHIMATKLLEKGKIISEALSRIMDIITKLPANMLENTAFRKVVETTLLVSRSTCDHFGDDATSSQPSPTQEDIDFWNNPEHLVAMVEIEKAALNRHALKKKLDDIPRSSMGFHSDWYGVVNVARKVANEGCILDMGLVKTVDGEMPSFSLGLTQDFLEKTNDNASAKIPDSYIADQEPIGELIIPDVVSVDCGEKVKDAETEVVLKTYKAKGKRKVADKKGKGVGEVGKLH